MAENTTAPQQTRVDVDDVLAGFEHEISRLTRRAIFAEAEARALRLQHQQDQAQIEELELLVRTSRQPEGDVVVAGDERPGD